MLRNLVPQRVRVFVPERRRVVASGVRTEFRDAMSGRTRIVSAWSWKH
jgi:hypothetical protein